MCVAAGCTDLFPATQDRGLPGAVLDLTGVEGLNGITRLPQGWRLGATTTWHQIADAELPPGFAALQQAARQVGSVQIQNAGTIAGNLCHASPAADGVPPLLAMGARVQLASGRVQRELALCDFLIGPRETALAPDEMMTAIVIPAQHAQGRSAFEKLGARRHLVISIAMVAVRLVVQGGQITRAALAVGACSPVAQRLIAQEQALIGVPVAQAVAAIDPALIPLSPIDDLRSDAAYRRQAVPELLRRAIKACLT